jgi:hypothetical protein
MISPHTPSGRRMINPNDNNAWDWGLNGVLPGNQRRRPTNPPTWYRRAAVVGAVDRAGKKGG